MPVLHRSHPAFRALTTLSLALTCALAPLPLAGTAPLAHAAPSKGPDTVADAAEKVMDAVVNISTSQNVAASRSVTVPDLPPGAPFEEFFEEYFKNRQEDGGENTPRRVSSLGSGFVIDPAGLIVTNNHVIADADEIYANFNDGTKLKAELVGRDTKTDLALLRVKPEKPLTAVSFGNSEIVRVGDWVMAIGNPFGLGGSLSVGVVSARNRDINAGPYDNFIQTDAAINRGNSGGPLFNMEGEVVGVNTAIISPSGGSIGIGFAVPASSAKAVLAQLEQYGEVRRGWIGVRIQPVTEEIAETLDLSKAQGALVGVVNKDGPADKAGLHVGDIILKFDGKDIKTIRDLTRTVADTMVDREVPVEIIRKGKARTLRLKVARMPADEGEAKAASNAEKKSEKPSPQQEALGLTLANMSDELRTENKINPSIKGVLITDVAENSPAAERGLRPGLVIVQVGQEAVENTDMLERRIAALRKAGRNAVLLLISDGTGEQEFVTLPLD
ncbi:DegQ family serine endoprotease [Xanthobacter sp. TB0136]|uniref:DegQ family serine endoprotease n=1 Tax=Xanthobacter sp. TB0136 TaxID=3459177 RepID=UPI0040399F2B